MEFYLSSAPLQTQARRQDLPDAGQVLVARQRRRHLQFLADMLLLCGVALGTQARSHRAPSQHGAGRLVQLVQHAVKKGQERQAKGRGRGCGGGH